MLRSTRVKILIVEDEPKTGDYLRQGLREAGFTVELVTKRTTLPEVMKSDGWQVGVAGEVLEVAGDVLGV